MIWINNIISDFKKNNFTIKISIFLNADYIFDKKTSMVFCVL